MAVFSILATSCANHGKYEGYYFCYDAVDVRANPSDTSAVVLKLICDRRPGNYKQKDGEIPWAFVTDNMEPVPIGVKKIDESGKWGYIDEKVPLVFHWQGWIPLDKMIYCGGQDKTVAENTWEVTEDNLVMYKHPAVNDKEKLVHTLSKGDKVQVRATSKDWSFVSWLRYTDTGAESHKYGWVKTKNLAVAQAVSQEDLKESAYEKMEQKNIAKASSGGALSQWGIRHGIKLKSVLQKVHLVGAGLIVLFVLALIIPSFKRKKWLEVLVVLPLCAVILFLFSYLTSAPALVYALLSVVFAYGVLYPMLYTHQSELFPTLFRVLSYGVGFYSLAIFQLLSGKNIIVSIVLFVVFAAIFIWITELIANKVASYICPHCGYYATHPKLQTIYDGTTSSDSHGTEDVYSHTTTHMEGKTKVITKHYDRKHYTDTTTTHHYRMVHLCMQCGKEFENFKSKSSTKRRYN